MVDILFKIAGILGILFMCGGVIKKNNIMFLISGILLLIYTLFLGDLIFIILECIFIITTAYSMLFKKGHGKEKGNKAIKEVSNLNKKEILEDYLNLCKLYKDIILDLNNENEVKYQLGILSLSSELKRMENILSVREKSDLVRVCKNNNIVLCENFPIRNNIINNGLYWTTNGLSWTEV